MAQQRLAEVVIVDREGNRLLTGKVASRPPQQIGDRFVVDGQLFEATSQPKIEFGELIETKGQPPPRWTTRAKFVTNINNR